MEFIIFGVILGLVFGWPVALALCVIVPVILLLVYLINLGANND